ncbi:Spindle pole body component [Venturia inaequalis]|nr:Spindle pole body component [Venturia inaequalis]
MSRDTKMTNQALHTKQQSRLAVPRSQELQRLQDENSKLRNENTDLKTQSRLDRASQAAKEKELHRLRTANSKLQKEKSDMKNQLKTRPTQEHLAKAEEEANEGKIAVRRKEEMAREIAKKTEIIKRLSKQNEEILSDYESLMKERFYSATKKKLEEARHMVEELQRSGLESYHENVRLTAEMTKLENTEPNIILLERVRECEDKWFMRVNELESENENMKYQRFIHFKESEDVVAENRRLKRRLEDLERKEGNLVLDEGRAKGEARLAEMDREFA